MPVAPRTLVLVTFLACWSLACQSPASAPTSRPAPEAAAPSAAAGNALSGAPPAAATPLKIVYGSPTGGNSVLWVTKEAGLFEQNGLDVSLDIVRGNTLVLAALMNGQIDVAQNAGPAVIDAALASQNIVALAAFTDRYTYKLMVDPSIRQPTDLRGQSFAASSPGSSDEVAARQVLAALGVEPRDMDFVTVQDQNGRVAAMRQGLAKATIVVPPNDVVLKHAGFVDLADTADLPLPYVGVAPSVTPDFLRKNRPALERYMSAMVQGIAYYKQNPDFVKQVISRYMELDDQEALDSAASYYGRVLQRLPYVPPAGVQAMVDAAAAQNPAARNLDPASLYDNTLVQRVDQSGLVHSLYPD